MQNLNNLLKILLEAKLDFVLVGGYAATVHGASQLTQDIDICAVLSSENLKILRAALNEYDPKFRMNPNFQPSFMERPREGEQVHNL